MWNGLLSSWEGELLWVTKDSMDWLLTQVLLAEHLQNSRVIIPVPASVTLVHYSQTWTRCFRKCRALLKELHHLRSLEMLKPLYRTGLVSDVSPHLSVDLSSATYQLDVFFHHLTQECYCRAWYMKLSLQIGFKGGFKIRLRSFHVNIWWSLLSDETVKVCLWHIHVFIVPLLWYFI